MLLRKSDSTRSKITAIFLFSMVLLIASDIINLTPHRADLEFIYIPLMFCTAVALFMKKRLYYSGYLAIIIMAFMAFVSTYISDTVQMKTGYLKFFVFVFAYILISSVGLEFRNVKTIIDIYAYVSLVISVWLIITYMLGINLSVQHRATLVVFGVEKDQNYTGAFFAPAATLFFYKFMYSERKIRSICFMVLILLAIFFTGSRAAMLTCILCIPFAFLFASSRVSPLKKVFYSVIIVIVGLIVYTLLGSSVLFSRMTNVEGYTDNIRLVIWGYAMRGFTRHPIIGSGLYSASAYSQQYVRWVSHNSFLDILIGQGIIGTALFGFVFYRLIKDTMQGNRMFIFVIILSFLLPYFFLNGYETLSFWLPMILIKLISDGCREHPHSELFRKTEYPVHEVK